MANYKVLQNIKFQGEIVKPGEVVDFPDEQVAKSLVADHILELVEAAQPQPPLAQNPPQSSQPQTTQEPTQTPQTQPSQPQASQQSQPPTPAGTTPAQIRHDLESMEASSTSQNGGQEA